MELVTSVEDCVGKDLLAWVGYSRSGRETACFPRPQFRMDGGSLSRIDPSVFPDVGGIVALLTDGVDSDTVRSRFGEVVIMRFNNYGPEINPAYKDGNNQNQFRSHLNIRLSSGRSDLEFVELSKHGASKSLLQVVDVSGLPQLAGRAGEGLSLVVSDEILTDLVMVVDRSPDRERLFGPFAPRVPGVGELELVGSQDHDYRVYEFPCSLLESKLELCDREGDARFGFFELTAIESAIERGAFANGFDWVPRSLLVKVVGRALSLSEETRDLSKNKLRKIRGEVGAITDATAEIRLDDERRERVLDLMSDVEYFGTLPDALQDAVFERMSDEKLAEIVLAPQNLPRFKEQILEIPEIADEVSQQRRALMASLDSLREEETAARRRRDEALKELAQAEKSLEDRLRMAEKAKSEELERLEAECERLRGEVGLLEGRLERLRAEEAEVNEGVAGLVALLDDKVRLSAEALRESALNKILSMGEKDRGIGASREASPCEVAAPEVIVRDEGQDLVDRLADVVCERAGRSYDRNELIDFYICLTQGFITTFAGMPGTGKTSLCRLLARGLGIEGRGLGRFVEVSVERGWTSYRDYIEYYNPLTGIEERSNPEVFSLLERLGAGGGDAASEAPGIILLDEANLSPIEHYWAPFLGACDSFHDGRSTLSLGGSRSLPIPSTVRFLATVNYDHTTEELSPRFLDRSWVVMLGADSSVSDDLPEEDRTAPEGVVPYRSLLATFGRRRETTMDAASESIYSEVLQACADNGRPVSQRSRNMMRGFISAASELMDTKKVGTRFDPVDMAVAQKVLPAISGPRETYEGLVNALEKACSQLRVSSALIASIKRAGESSGYYQFFA